SLKIISGTYDIRTVQRAVRAKKYIAIKDGNITIESEEDSIRTTKDDDVAFGHIVIEGGNIKIETNSEGIQATGTVQITGGTVDIHDEGQKSNAIKSDRMIYVENAQVIVDSLKALKAEGGMIATKDAIVARAK
ncbi:MAG: carbohydrate-binding domain-containing protein, partial [Lachnospiraceae bacterium]|nr:carbohydrate-binding domain-containing protein [Lachnospiraceae bacterium]